MLILLWWWSWTLPWQVTQVVHRSPQKLEKSVALYKPCLSISRKMNPWSSTLCMNTSSRSCTKPVIHRKPIAIVIIHWRTTSAVWFKHFKTKKRTLLSSATHHSKNKWFLEKNLLRHSPLFSTLPCHLQTCLRHCWTTLPSPSSNNSSITFLAAQVKTLRTLRIFVWAQQCLHLFSSSQTKSTSETLWFSLSITSSRP